MERRRPQSRSTTNAERPRSARRGRSSFVQAAVAAGIVAAGAFSGAPAAADSAKSEQYFQQGRQLLQQGKVVDACALFKKSLVEEPSIGGELNLGDCYEKLGRAASALEHFRSAETMAGAVDVSRGKEARRRGDRLESIVARLVVRVISAPEQARVYVDGVPAPPTTKGVPVDPGEHLVQLKDGERVVTEARISLAPQEHRETTLDGSKPEVASPRSNPGTPTAPADPPRESSTFPQRPIGIVVAGIGAAALAVGGVMLVLADGKKSEVTALCPDYPACPASLRKEAIEINDAGRSQQSLGFISIIAGAVLIGGGAALYFTAPSSPPKGASFRLTPLLGETQGVAAVGTF